jgi:hypothetical protein
MISYHFYAVNQDDEGPGAKQHSYFAQADDFLNVARDIQQIREEKKGNLTLRIGPTVYREFWALDAHFILQAARYLGYDADA